MTKTTEMRNKSLVIKLLKRTKFKMMSKMMRLPNNLRMMPELLKKIKNNFRIRTKMLHLLIGMSQTMMRLSMMILLLVILRITKTMLETSKLMKMLKFSKSKSRKLQLKVAKKIKNKRIKKVRMLLRM